MAVRPRIVSLCPSNTEIVDALGLADCLVGVDNYSDYPPYIVEGLPRLGPDLNIEFDKVRSLQPDMVIASLSVPGMERVVEALDASGLPYVVLSPHSIEDIFADMETVGQALGPAVSRSSVASSINRLRNRVDRIRAATASIRSTPKLYWEWWPTPIFSPGSNNWLTEVSQFAGAQNIFGMSPGDQVKDHGDRVIAEQPDYALMVWTGIPQQKVPLEKILARPGWESIPAFRNHHIYILPEGLYCRPSPRLIDGLEQLVGLIHPHLRTELGLHEPHEYGPVRNAKGEWMGGVVPTGS